MDRPTLLVVDDDPYTRMALGAMFARRGWHVLLAATQAEGLTFLDPAPHCLILDLNLPAAPARWSYGRCGPGIPGPGWWSARGRTTRAGSPWSGACGRIAAGSHRRPGGP